ncbi:MAG: GNAT family N-acetyltransferase, partial [Planctomycetaceae bacterium]|nr:GNAT family N-acetyltransferase [Planctomycetaceae bacterium]
MSNLIIERVVSGRQKKEFLQFPWTLYRGDPNWIPPLRGDQKEILGYKPHPFHARNTIQTFVARRGNEVCGRIAAILNQGHIAQYNERRGFFGFFDCIDDQDVANGLFDAVRQWFADQDIHRLRGPMNPSMNYELGLLIDGFDSSPVFMMTYNLPYYERLVENYGFRKSQDLYAFWGQVSMLPAIAAKLTPISEQIIERYDVKVRSLDTTRFREDVESFLSIYNRSLVNTWGFVPMSQDEVRRMAAGLRHVIVPEMTVAVEIDGRMVGACFGLPDYNPRIREIDGRLFPFGFIHLLRNRRAIKRIRVISTNVLPEFQRMGLGLVLLSGLVPKALEWGLEEAEFSWVLESNRLSYGALKKGGAKITKTYRVYDLDEEQGSGEEGQSSSRNSSHALVATPLAPLAIREVKTRQDLDRFVRVPWRIYADDPHWVPPLLREVKAFLDRDKHPFYRHGEATTFLALRNEQPVGRVLVSDDVLYNKQSNLSVGCFGMFECLDDEEAARGLLDAASGWLRARGRKTLLGPIDYSLNYPCGLLIEGFETPPRIMMNHNRPYYGRLLESYGLRKAKDLDAWWFEDSRDLAGRWKARAERLARRARIVIRHFRMNEFAAEVGRCLEVYNATMADQWMYPKLTRAEFETFAKELARTAVPEQILLAEIDGRVVGL